MKENYEVELIAYNPIFDVGMIRFKSDAECLTFIKLMSNAICIARYPTARWEVFRAPKCSISETGKWDSNFQQNLVGLETPGITGGDRKELWEFIYTNGRIAWRLEKSRLEF